MPSDHIIDILSPSPGIQRDGTPFDSTLCMDGQWTRFYRGRPKKIGGRVLLDPGNTEIIRNMYLVDQINNVTDCYLGRPSTLSVTSITNGVSNPEFDRTPTNFVADPNNNWTFDRYTVLDVENTVNLGNNPISTTNGSGIVVVTVPSTLNLSNEDFVTIAGATTTNNITGTQLNITASITVLSLTTFSYQTVGTADATGSGGGNSVSYTTSGPVNYIIAHAAPNVLDINSSSEQLIFWGDTESSAPLTEISSSHQKCSGGIAVFPPFVFKYGNDGVVGWTSNPGGDWSDAIFASITGTKIVKGLSTRGGSNPSSGLFWSLNSLIRATYVGGDTQYNFDTIQTDLTILSQNCIVTHNNVFYWIGTKQFYLYNGVVKPIPNNTNRITFFNNIDLNYRNKVFGIYKEDYNEIWWYYTKKGNTENSDIIVLKLGDEESSQFWFDSVHGRTAGVSSGLYPYPLEADSQPMLNKFNPNSTITIDLANNPIATIMGSGVVTVTIPSNPNLKNGNLVTIAGATTFNNITTVELNITTAITVINDTSFTYQTAGTANATGSGGGNLVTYSYQVPNLYYGLWQEETGTDQVQYGQSLAIDSYFDTNYITYFEKSPSDDRQMRVRRIEPDFAQIGPMTMTINSRSFAQSIPITSKVYTFMPGQETINLDKVDTANMGRIVNFRFESNISGGDYEMGKVVLNYAPGDVRP